MDINLYFRCKNTWIQDSLRKVISVFKEIDGDIQILVCWQKIGCLVNWKHSWIIVIDQHFFESAFDVGVWPWSEVPLTVMMHIRICRSINAWLVYAHAGTHVQKSIKPNNCFSGKYLPFFGIDQWKIPFFGYLTRSIWRSIMSGIIKHALAALLSLWWIGIWSRGLVDGGNCLCLGCVALLKTMLNEEPGRLHSSYRRWLKAFVWVVTV
jgi:hypothetical protein